MISNTDSSSGSTVPQLMRYCEARSIVWSTRLKLALKYGIAVTLIIAAWVALKHFVLHFEGQSAQLADLAVFNLSAIVALMLGIKEKRLANGNHLTFFQGLGTGISIAVTYSILTSLYFVLLLSLVGPK